MQFIQQHLASSSKAINVIATSINFLKSHLSLKFNYGFADTDCTITFVIYPFRFNPLTIFQQKS